MIKVVILLTAKIHTCTHKANERERERKDYAKKRNLTMVKRILDFGVLSDAFPWYCVGLVGILDV